MVAHFTMRTIGVYQVFRFVESIRLLRTSRQNRKRPDLHHTRATCSELPSYIRAMLVRWINGKQTIKLEMSWRGVRIRHGTIITWLLRKPCASTSFPTSTYLQECTKTD